jgi:hypothetical protein
MKTKHAIIIFLIGYCLDFIGVLIRVLHQFGYEIVLIIAALLKLFAIVLFAYKLFAGWLYQS